MICRNRGKKAKYAEIVNSYSMTVKNKSGKLVDLVDFYLANCKKRCIIYFVLV